MSFLADKLLMILPAKGEPGITPKEAWDTLGNVGALDSVRTTLLSLHKKGLVDRELVYDSKGTFSVPIGSFWKMADGSTTATTAITNGERE